MPTKLVAIALTLLIASVCGGCGASPTRTESIAWIGARCDVPSEPPRDVVLNGSFEQPRLVHGSWAVYEALPGWTTSYGPGIEVQNNDDLDRPAFDGRQYVELDSHAASGMHQDVTNIDAALYELRFAYAPRPGTSAEDNAIEVHFGGVLVDTLTGTGEGLTRNTWSMRRYRVRSRGGIVRLEFRYVGVSNSVGGYLDAIELVRVG